MVLVHLSGVAQSPLGARYAGASEEKERDAIEKELATIITTHADLMPHGDSYPSKVGWTNRGRPLQCVDGEQSGVFAKCAALGSGSCDATRHDMS